MLFETLADVRFKDWAFEVRANPMSFRLRFEAADTISGNPMDQWTRWWIVEDTDTKEGVVKTALLAVLTAVEHETREEFFYKGKRVFGPHRGV